MSVTSAAVPLPYHDLFQRADEELVAGATRHAEPARLVLEEVHVVPNHGKKVAVVTEDGDRAARREVLVAKSAIELLFGEAVPEGPLTWTAITFSAPQSASTSRTVLPHSTS
jgi:hypothetical protein